MVATRMYMISWQAQCAAIEAPLAGDAAGFSIESVLMLSGIRAGNKKISLMHYLAALVATKEPHLLDFAVDLKGIPRHMPAMRLHDFSQLFVPYHEPFVCPSSGAARRSPVLLRNMYTRSPSLFLLLKNLSFGKRRRAQSFMPLS
jgi:hypothetical protein